MAGPCQGASGIGLQKSRGASAWPNGHVGRQKGITDRARVDAEMRADGLLGSGVVRAGAELDVSALSPLPWSVEQCGLFGTMALLVPAGGLQEVCGSDTSPSVTFGPSYAGAFGPRSRGDGAKLLRPW